MTTREQLEAEAAELYPITKALDVDHTAVVIAHRSAHVRAKTVSAEQVEAAARHMRDQATRSLEDIGVYLITMSPNQVKHWFTFGQDTLEAAGFYVEGDDE